MPSNFKPKRSHLKYSLLFIILILFLLIFLFLMRIHHNHVIRNRTEAQSIPYVYTAVVKKGPTTEEIILPGNVEPWHEATLYARTNGYVKTWYVDIGSRVKAGDLLALISAPEVDEQLRQTEANLVTAKANYALAKITAQRWVNLLKTDSVSKQETDEKVSAEKAYAAIVAATAANRDRLIKLVNFERIVAPFDGIISSRTTDIGSLIDAGSNAPRPLFQIVQGNLLRIYVQIPQYYSSSIKPGLEVSLHFREHPGQSFKAYLYRTADAIDYTTRTLLAQFIAENKNYILLPGGYTEVHLKIPMPVKVVRISTNALLFRFEGLKVAVVNKNNRVILRPVTISRDFGDTVEISSGLKPGETIILSPSDSIYNNELVHITSSKKDL